MSELCDRPLPEDAIATHERRQREAIDVLHRGFMTACEPYNKELVRLEMLRPMRSVMYSMQAVHAQTLQQEPFEVLRAAKDAYRSYGCRSHADGPMSLEAYVGRAVLQIITAGPKS